ncbi:hypothetical protein EYF80_029226 [Liparis tanakae]|uniref:Uncharacterized protein n=1 Tax=Liparis tanakae TaxID=230148 RepID=A0A4Z2H5V9_9TELE|nr:hypothetical protein EYF80_029226 [Liparis tanakae]
MKVQFPLPQFNLHPRHAVLTRAFIMTQQSDFLSPKLTASCSLNEMHASAEGFSGETDWASRQPGPARSDLTPPPRRPNCLSNLTLFA